MRNSENGVHRISLNSFAPKKQSSLFSLFVFSRSTDDAPIDGFRPGKRSSGDERELAIWIELGEIDVSVGCVWGGAWTGGNQCAGLTAKKKKVGLASEERRSCGIRVGF